VRARWIGHRLHAEVNVVIDPELTVAAGHEIAKNVNHQLLHHLPFLSRAIIHIDPIEQAGGQYHHITEHAHDDLPVHSH